MRCIEAILYHCRSNPAATAIATPGSPVDSIKYGQLFNLLNAVVTAARKAGLRPGQTVAIHATDAIVHAVLALGLMGSGMATMSLIEPAVPEGIAVDAVVTDRPQMFPESASVIAVDASWLQGNTPADGEWMTAIDATGDVCRIERASSRGGAGQAVAITEGLLARRLAHDRVSMGPLFASAARLFSTFAVASPEGFNAMLSMLTQGGTVYFPGRDALAILQFLGPYRVQALMTSPEALETLLHYFEADENLESDFEVIVCRTTGLSPAVADRARACLCPNLYSVYAPVEASTVACGPVEAFAGTPGAVGILCPGVRVDVIGAGGVSQPAGSGGSIRIRSPYLARGYSFGRDPGTPSFQDDAFEPGVVGHVTADGLLVLDDANNRSQRLAGGQA